MKKTGREIVVVGRLTGIVFKMIVVVVKRREKS